MLGTFWWLLSGHLFANCPCEKGVGDFLKKLLIAWSRLWLSHRSAYWRRGSSVTESRINFTTKDWYLGILKYIPKKFKSSQVKFREYKIWINFLAIWILLKFCVNNANGKVNNFGHHFLRDIIFNIIIWDKNRVDYFMNSDKLLRQVLR